MPRIAVLATAVLILAVAAAGCGGSSNSSSPSTSSTSTSPPQTTSPPSSGTSASALTEAADPSGQLKFTKNSLTAKPGKVTIHFTNNSSLPHNFTLQPKAGGALVGATPTFSGATKTLTVNLKPGTYTFFCSVPGHRQAGMQGTLTVK